MKYRKTPHLFKMVYAERERYIIPYFVIEKQIARMSLGQKGHDYFRSRYVASTVQLALHLPWPPCSCCPRCLWDWSLAQGVLHIVPLQVGKRRLGRSQRGAGEWAGSGANGWPAGQRLSSFPQPILIRSVDESTEIHCSRGARAGEGCSAWAFAAQSNWSHMAHHKTSPKRTIHHFVQWALDSEWVELKNKTKQPPHHHHPPPKPKQTHKNWF